MASNKIVRFGPIALTTTTTTNLLNPPTSTGGVNAGSAAQYVIIRHLRVMNKTGTAASVATWVGATGTNSAGNEGPFPGQATAGALTQGVSIPANSYVDSYVPIRLDSTDFLVGGAGTASALVIMGSMEIGVA